LICNSQTASLFLETDGRRLAQSSPVLHESGRRVRNKAHRKILHAASETSARHGSQALDGLVGEQPASRILLRSDLTQHAWKAFFPMRIAIAVILLLLAGLGVVLFTQHRSAPSEIAPRVAPVAPPSKETNSLESVGNNDGTVNAQRKSVADLKAQTLTDPQNSKSGNRQNSGSVAASAPVEILLDPVSSTASSSSSSAAEDEFFAKKYGEMGVESRRKELEDLRQGLQALIDPSQREPVNPDVVIQVKREISWLESHLDS
jgi:hypothetical protein